MSERKSANPFYVILTVVGVVFVITACVYGVVGLRDLGPQPSQATEDPRGPHPLIALMNAHGIKILGVEIAVLAVATIGAIWLDAVRDATERGKSGDQVTNHNTKQSDS